MFAMTVRREPFRNKLHVRSVFSFERRQWSTPVLQRCRRFDKFREACEVELIRSIASIRRTYRYTAQSCSFHSLVAVRISQAGMPSLAVAERNWCAAKNEVATAAQALRRFRGLHAPELRPSVLFI